MGRTAMVAVVAMSCGLGLNRTDRAKPRPGATWGSLASSLITSLEEVPCQSGTMRVSRVVVPASPAASAGGVFTDLGQALAALCVAGIALDRRAVGLRRALAGGTRWLRRLHSGLVGDQVTWLVAGLALLAALGEAALH